MNDKAKTLISNILYVAAVILISFLIVRFVGQRTEVIGSSMVPTLEDGNQLITDKITYRFREPERFDIIVFPHEANEFYIKRIIGMPGETVEIRDDHEIYINGELLEEDYGYGVTDPQELAGEKVILGDNEYFVLGDNREVSLDSRYAEATGMEKEMILYLEDHYSEDISLDGLAAHFQRTPEYLCSIFKAATGETISHYLRRIRIHRAKVLLMERPDTGLREISEACGFHSVSYFGKVFREATGFTPQGYRLGVPLE